MSLLSLILAAHLMAPIPIHPIVTPGMPSVSSALQDAGTIETDLMDLETVANLDDWANTGRLADRTLEDFRDFVTAARIWGLSDVQRDLAASLAHLGDIEGSAAPDTEAQVRRDWKDLDEETRRLRAEATKGPSAVDMTRVDPHLAALKKAIDSKDWPKSRTLAEEASKALRAASAPGTLDTTHELIGACETHLMDVREAAREKIGTETRADTRRAIAEWQALRGQMVK